ncbi:MAG: hypothetical protein PHF50_01400 [Patescibacteria group bacterium]|nr:hypothetical protein [Patescibacteria group bacterium]
MNKQNLDKLELELLKRLKAREKRKKGSMKVSGTSVKRLGRLIAK